MQKNRRLRSGQNLLTTLSSVKLWSGRALGKAESIARSRLHRSYGISATAFALVGSSRLRGFQEE
jgi:hypothetical protein